MHWIASDAIPIVFCCFDAVVAVMTIVVSATAASIDIDHTLQEVTLHHFYLCWQCCPPTYTSMHYMHYITATISNCVALRMH